MKRREKWSAPCCRPAGWNSRLAVLAAVSLGSNVGDRSAHLHFAIDRLRSILDSVVVSSFLETTPVGVAPQPDFLNAAAVGVVTLSARELLGTMLAIERERGRERPFVGAPRTLDLDLILYGSDIRDEPGLILPHPRFRERRFVLAPLAEIAPSVIDPVTGQTIAALLSRL